MVQLTDPQRKVMEFIYALMSHSGLPPTLREICHHLGWTAVGSAQDVVNALRKKGVLEQTERGKSRQLILSKWAIEKFLLTSPQNSNPVSNSNSSTNLASGGVDNYNLFLVPMLGYVQAGQQNETIEQLDQKIPFYFPVHTKKIERFFALIAEGYSMLYAGILPGDQLLVESQSDAFDGEIVVASTCPGSATVKRYTARGSILYQKALDSYTTKKSSLDNLIPPAFLQPENPLFEPIPFGLSEDSRILGVVRSLVRPVIK